MFGRKPNLPIDIMFRLTSNRNEDPPCYDEFVERLRDNLQSSNKTASGIAQKAKAKHKRLYDRGTKDAPLRLGDRVLVQHKHIIGTQKLADRWETHRYVVVSKYPDLPVYVVCNQETGKERTLHRNLLTPCMFLPITENNTDETTAEPDSMSPSPPVDEAIQDEPTPGSNSSVSLEFHYRCYSIGLWKSTHSNHLYNTINLQKWHS